VGGSLWLLDVRDSAAPFAAAAGIAFLLSAVFWILVAPAWLARLARPGPAARVAAGFLVVWPTWFGFVVLREASPWLLLAIAVTVWIADIGAYFAGRAFGRHKLAPAVSPGKTWEGVIGGLAGVVLYGVLLDFFAHVHPSPLAPVFAAAAGIPAILAMVVLTALSVVGDLFESWMKRGAGLKDSSQLLPGHGGVLDRIDALTSTLPMAALALSLAA
jgi:phosphatidate cytidylyltransferase